MSVYVGQNGYRECTIVDCSVPGEGKRPFIPHARRETLQLLQEVVGGNLVNKCGENSLHVIQELFTWDKKKRLWNFMDGTVIFWIGRNGLMAATTEPRYYRWLDLFEAAGVR